MATTTRKIDRRQRENKAIEVPTLEEEDLPVIPIGQAMELSGIKHRATKILNLEALALNKRKVLTWGEFSEFYRMSVWCRMARQGERGDRRAEYLVLKRKNLVSHALKKFVPFFDVDENLRRIKDDIQRGIGNRRSA